MNELREEIDRIARIVRGLLTFHRQPTSVGAGAECRSLTRSAAGFKQFLRQSDFNIDNKEARDYNATV